jgi:hypothetical protein
MSPEKGGSESAARVAAGGCEAAAAQAGESGAGDESSDPLSLPAAEGRASDEGSEGPSVLSDKESSVLEESAPREAGEKEDTGEGLGEDGWRRDEVGSEADDALVGAPRAPDEVGSS